MRPPRVALRRPDPMAYCLPPSDAYPSRRHPECQLRLEAYRRLLPLLLSVPPSPLTTPPLLLPPPSPPASPSPLVTPFRIRFAPPGTLAAPLLLRQGSLHDISAELLHKPFEAEVLAMSSRWTRSAARDLPEPKSPLNTMTPWIGTALSYLPTEESSAWVTAVLGNSYSPRSERHFTAFRPHPPHKPTVNPGLSLPRADTRRVVARGGTRSCSPSRSKSDATGLGYAVRYAVIPRHALTHPV